MWSPVSRTRLVRSPHPSTVAANGAAWPGVQSVSITVTPSASMTAPALGWPWPGSRASQA
jgi:hypothetical protein